MKLKVITLGDKRLRQKSVPIADPSDPKIREFTKDLANTMYQSDGVGIAAPQVGKNIRVVVIGVKSGPLVMINPSISRKSWRQVEAEEGCLSVPGVFGLVRRSRSLLVSFYDAHGTKQKLKAEGMFARVIQHEVDHLNGVLFIDRTKKYTKTVNNRKKI
ncbi:MAG: peptide deformylase [Patescibacteria group bacterium]